MDSGSSLYFINPRTGGYRIWYINTGIVGHLYVLSMQGHLLYSINAETGWHLMYSIKVTDRKSPYTIFKKWNGGTIAIDGPEVMQTRVILRVL